MPTYEYRCNGCKHRFEEIQSFSEAPLKKCPACKKKKLERLIGTGAAVIFKGSGFYQTDYRSESYKNAAKADEVKPAEKAPTDGTTKTTDAKPAGGGSETSKDSSSAKKTKS